MLQHPRFFYTKLEMHKGGDELPETAGIDEINVEFAVVCCFYDLLTDSNLSSLQEVRG